MTASPMSRDVGDRPARLIAFYLPQFHPTPENDRWWGRGFTEWTNVARARPLFPGHAQPRIPADLGFYDLRLTEAQEQQAALARTVGIEGFCYWHYWFSGTRLLHRPVDQLLAAGRPDLPFCLAWANETWSRRWLGEEQDILIRQDYSPADDRAHIEWLLPVFADPRYLTVEGRPVFLVYRPVDLPDPRATTTLWRERCRAEGLPDPYLLGVNGHAVTVDCRLLGFDGTVNFEPQLGALPSVNADGLKVYDDAEARRRMASWYPDYPAHPTVYVRWDTTPRRGGDAIVFVNGRVENFTRALEGAIARVDGQGEHALVFVNAWNEWAEGNYLEPDLADGRRYLDAIAATTTPWT